MAILVAIFSKIKQVLASYVLFDDNSTPSSFFVLNGNPYSMPLIYAIVLACIVVLGYFCWLSYRQEIQEEKLQEKSASKEDGFTSYNLTWVNKLINWAHISSASEIPQAVKRWIEDVNITLSKNKSPLKILVYGIREGSIPPWLREIGQFEKVKNQLEVPVLLDFAEFGFLVSVQEEDKGKVIASTYAAIVEQFQCWCATTVSRINGQVLAKIEPSLERPKSVKFRLKSLSDQKIASTVPEVVADIIKSSVLRTPFYLNVTTWGSLIPLNPKQPTQWRQKDDNGNALTRVQAESNPKSADHQSVLWSSSDLESPATSPNIRMNGLCSAKNNDMQIQKSSTMPSDTSRMVADQLRTTNMTHNLSGSLGSLVGIKRTPSGRGPAKPIRSREKQLLVNVIRATGLPSVGIYYCKASLDNPHQKRQTTPVNSGPDRSWASDDLHFDLSARSSEVKLVVYEKSTSNEKLKDSPVARAVLCLDGINIDQPSEQVLQLKTLNKEQAELTLRLTFTENPVDASFVRPYNDSPSRYCSPRRSLDLSLIANQLPPMVDEKGDARSKSPSSTLSSFSSENVSVNGSNKSQSSPSTTVTTTTTRKVTPNRTSQLIENMNKRTDSSTQNGVSQSKSDVSLVNGSVAETAMNDLSKEAEILDRSPELKGQITKGRVVITAIAKSANDDDPGKAKTVEAAKDIHGQQLIPDKMEKQAGDELYYSMCSLSTPSGADVPAPEKPAGNQQELKESSDHPPATKPKKKRRKRDDRPKSMVAGVEREDMPGEERKEWPKVRRSRSLVFGKGRKKQYKTGSATDLHKHESGREEVHPGYNDDAPVTVPENELQKRSKKKKSKSITKLFSKLGRKSSIQKSKKDSDFTELTGRSSALEPSVNSTSFASEHPSQEDDGSVRISPENNRPNSALGSEAESFISGATNSPGLSPSLSHNSSLRQEKASVNRSKSLRKRLFGGKRKTVKQ